MEKSFDYILANRQNGTLYVGVTSDVIKRVWEHKNKSVQGFTIQYGVGKLVYYEQFRNADYAIKREKRLEKYNRIWKTKLIEKTNPEWKDLDEAIIHGSSGQAGG
jgi:putative endonuclease